MSTPKWRDPGSSDYYHGVADTYRPIYRSTDNDNTPRISTSPISTLASGRDPRRPIVSLGKEKTVKINRSPKLDTTPDKHNYLLEDNMHPGSLVITPRQSTSNISLRRAEFLLRLDKLAEAIKLSVTSSMRAEEIRTEADWRTRVRQRQSKHKDSFPVLFEEAQFRADQAEQIRLALEEKAYRAQNNQENAIQALTMVMEDILSTAKNGLDSKVAENASNFSADLPATNELLMETFTTESAGLKRRLRLIEDSLDATNRNIDSIIDKALTEGKLSELFAELKSQKREISKTYTLVDSAVHEIKQQNETVEEHERMLGKLETRIKEEQATHDSFECRLKGWESKLSEISMSIRAAIDVVMGEQEKKTGETEAIRRALAQAKTQLNETESRLKALIESQNSKDSEPRVAHEACLLPESFRQSEQKFEKGLDKLLETIRKEQGIAAQVFTDEIEESRKVLDEHDKALATLKTDQSIQKETLERFLKNAEASQGQRQPNISKGPSTLYPTSSNVLSGNGGVSMQPFEVGPKDIRVRNEAREPENRAVAQCTLAQQPDFSGLNGPHLTPHVGHPITQIDPLTITQIITWLHRLTANQQARERGMERLSQRNTEMVGLISHVRNAEIRPLGNVTKSLSESQSKMAQQNTVLNDTLAARIESVKLETQTDVAELRQKFREMSEEIQRIQLRLTVASPTPPNESAPTTHVLNTKSLGTDQIEASATAVDTLVQARNLGERAESSLDITTNASGKRPRSSSSSSDEDQVVSSLVTTKRNKHIRRMNKSSGGVT